jgi:hypothetical protein
LPFFFDLARGSALECAAAPDVLASKDLCELTVAAPGKERLRRVVSRAFGYEPLMRTA